MFNQWVFYSSSESNEIELLCFKMDKPTKEKKNPVVIKTFQKKQIEERDVKYGRTA